MNLEDKRYLLISIARKYTNNNRYEINELVNEAWLDDNVRSQTVVPLFCKAAQWAMLNYMRKMEHKNKKKYRVNFVPLILDESNNMEPEILLNDDLSSSDNFSVMLNLLNERQKTIVKLRVCDRLTLDQIGKKFHICGERVRQILKKSHDIMKNRYDKICA